METHKKKSQPKLTRTQSSLLRCSSPTARSSIQTEPDLLEDDERNSKKMENKKSTTRKPGSIRFVAAPVLGFFVACSLFSYLFYFLRVGASSEEIPTSENVLLSLIFVAVLLYLVAKNKGLIQRTGSALKHSWDGNTKKLGLFSSKGSSARPVQWSIGDSTEEGEKEKGVAGEGVEFYSNGDFYEGEFRGGKSNGSGVYHYFVSGRYEGDWVDGRYDGFGIENWARGSRYKGQYRQGVRHGYGVYRFYAGDSYAGEWCNGQSHGVGVQSCSDGSSYVGQFKFGVKHGLGRYHFRNGDRYAGEYFGDKIHGFGVYHFANGHSYEGAWHEGRRQGYGLYTFRSGDRRCGEWDAGNLKQSLPPLADAVLRAVQAARKTAVNATKLDRKDEEVNKVVIAANKAATAARVAAVKAVQNRMDGKFCDTGV